MVEDLDAIFAKIAQKETTVERGAIFERLTKMYLENKPIYRARFKNVYLWKKWPGRRGRDLGIDLVGVEHDGSLCAIQCKFHADPNYKIPLNEIEGLNTQATALAKTRKESINMMFVHSCNELGPNTKDTVEATGCQVIGRYEMQAGGISDWYFEDGRPVKHETPKKLRKYQEMAIQSVVSGLKTSDKGKMIMACGTGKTIVSLRIAEKIAPHGMVLYVVPSISLIGQTLKSWSADREIGHHYTLICSDKDMEDDGTSVMDLPFPATTNLAEIKKRINSRPKSRMGVVFSTYQSLDKAARAAEYDLAIADEAHRTATAKPDSNFAMLHDSPKRQSKVRAKKRLYMTATPKVYKETMKKKRPEAYSMDDETVYGPDMFKYTFQEAVNDEWLANVEIRVPVIRADELESYLDRDEQGFPEDTIDERVLMAAVWHALNHDGEKRTALLQRVIAFTNKIKASKQFAGGYSGKSMTPDENTTSQKNRKSKNEDPDVHLDRNMRSVVARYEKKSGTGNSIMVRHMDGSMRSGIRDTKLDWLKLSDRHPHECRVLSNARCLSEGVDVPALDGVIFLQPRKSIVDVIQAVGRVMRKPAGKKVGYVIAPVIIPHGMTLEESFKDPKNKPWRTLWQVINAMRSHDPSLEAKLSRIGLGGDKPPSDIMQFANTEIIWMGSLHDAPEPETFGRLKTAMIERVIDKKYYDDRADELGVKARIVADVISKRQDPSIKKAIRNLHRGLRMVVNDTVSEQQTINVLAQHYILSKIFNSLFPKKFRSNNSISQILDDSVAESGIGEIVTNDELVLDEIVDEIRWLKEDEKQEYVKKIYGSFLIGFDKKTQERDGIVYTPNEIIDFMVNSVEHILKTRFGVGFNCRNVKVFDPFAGTGSFITRLLESGLIKPKMMQEKCGNDIWANENQLLAHYVASINIESVLKKQARLDKSIAFRHINFTDTFTHNPQYHLGKHHRKIQSTLTGKFDKIQESITLSNEQDIRVIMTNPPYSGQQKSFDDANPNLKYKKLDDEILNTYGKYVKGKQKGQQLDSYIRAIRWSTDRINDAGVIAFVINAGFLRSESGRGVRACLAKDFDEIWCFDLRGNQRTSGEQSKKEGGKIFGIGSRAPIVIIFLVKESKKQKCKINYKDIGDYLDRDEKFERIRGFGSIQDIKKWQKITPDKYYDWLDQRNDGKYYEYLPVGSVKAKKGDDEVVIFEKYSNGVKTNRDGWAYNSSKSILTDNMKRHITYCNSQDLDDPMLDSKKASWSGDLSEKIKKYMLKNGNKKPQFDSKKIRTSLYRPFFKQYLYLDRIHNNSVYRMPEIFPENHLKNPTICVPHKFDGRFSVLITNIIPDLELVHHSQCFPLYIYNEKNDVVDNITDSSLATFKTFYRNEKIKKIDIFYYVYALLHHEEYRTKYGNNLMRELPRIPMAPDFDAFKDAGKKLAKLHLEYETGPKYKDRIEGIIPDKISKLDFGKKKYQKKWIVDKSSILANGKPLVTCLPDMNYMINKKTTLEWILDRYDSKLDKRSGNTNNPLAQMTGREVVDMIARLAYVGAESDKIVRSLPKEFESKTWQARPRPQRTLDGKTQTMIL